MDPSSYVDRLYATERGRLRRLVRRITGQNASTDDIVHEAFLRLIRQPDGSVREAEAWLTRVVRNLVLNQIRHDSQRIVVGMPPHDVDAIIPDTPTVEAQLIARQNLHHCLTAIMALPPRRREIFVLHRFHDLTYDEIAARLGISRNTVMVQIVNALADLHGALGGSILHRG